MRSLPPAHDRRQKLNLRSLRKFHDLIHHLIYRLLLDLLPTLRTVRDTDPRIQKAEIIIDLRHSTHRGPGIPVCRLLIN